MLSSSSSEPSPLFNLPISTPATPPTLPSWVHKAPAAQCLWGGPAGARGSCFPPTGHRSLASTSLFPRGCFYCTGFFFFFSLYLCGFFYGDYFTIRNFGFLWQQPGLVFMRAFRKVYEAVAQTVPSGSRQSRAVGGGGRWSCLCVGFPFRLLGSKAVPRAGIPHDLSGKRKPREM